MHDFGHFRKKRRAAVSFAAAFVATAIIAVAFLFGPAATADATGYGYGLTIRDVVRATWPAGTRVEAAQIMYHEGHGIVNDGYCSFGILESTQAYYGSVAGLDAYECSAYAYRLYEEYGWAPWVTAGWVTPGAGKTPISYY